MTHLHRVARLVLAWGLMAPLIGCGYIADKDLIRVARFRDDYITRGDLNDVIRNMDAEERPEIRTRGDLLMTLQDYIDRRIKEEVADVLADEGKIHVPREAAEQMYIAKNPDSITDPTALKSMGMSDSDISILQQEREMGIDREVKRLLGEAAVRFRIQEAVQAGVMEATDAEVQEEYDLRKAELMNPERASIEGVFFPRSLENAPALAAEARQMLTTGQALDDVVAFARDNGGDVIEATLENDGRNPKFMSFWESASGTEPGSIVGPLYMPDWERVRRNVQNQPVREQLPDAYLVAKVTDRVAETQMTLEEARDILAGEILYRKMMDRLRDEFQIEIYEDKLPDPSMYDAGSDTMM